jgi:hypothetical protein
LTGAGVVGVLGVAGVVTVVEVEGPAGAVEVAGWAAPPRQIGMFQSFNAPVSVLSLKVRPCQVMLFLAHIIALDRKTNLDFQIVINRSRR